MSLTKLESYLNGLSAGPVQDKPTVEEMLATSWSELEWKGDDATTFSWNFQGRTHNMVWEPPFLGFSTDQRGAGTSGPSGANVYHWVLDLQLRTRRIEGTNKRLVQHSEERPDVRSIAKRLAALILRGSKDPALKWYHEGTTVVISMPKALGDASEQTMQGRRKPFQDAIEPLLKAHGWFPERRRGQFVYDPDESTADAMAGKRKQIADKSEPIRSEDDRVPKPKADGGIRISDRPGYRSGSSGIRKTLSGVCHWQGCGKQGHDAVDYVDYCPEHATMKRRRILLDGLPTLTYDDRGRPSNKSWLGKFALLASQHMRELSQAKIRDRGILFATEGSRVSFSIDRHPTGLVVRQQWEYDIKTGDSRKLEEQTINSDYKWNTEGKFYECPSCGSPLKLKPGVVRCLAPGCNYADYHEHSL